MLPDWLRDAPPVGAHRVDVRGGKRRRKSFWRRTLKALEETLRREVLAAESAEKPSFLQRLDPRAKLAGAAVLIVSLTFVRTPALLAISSAACAVLAATSGVSLRMYLKTLTPVLIFATLVAMPAALGLVTPGRPLLEPAGIIITREGVYVAARFVLGVLACVSVASVVILTTRWPSLLWSLSAFRIPRPFILVLSMTYRYLFVFLRNAQEMHLAKESRTLSRDRPTSGQAWAAARAGDLFIRARRLSEQVYLAMAARGFGGGDPRSTLNSNLSTMDNPIFQLSNVSYTYPTDEVALTGVSLQVHPGERLAILGANASGKSTLLHLLDGLYFPSSGTITALGVELIEDVLEKEEFRRAFRSRVQFIFQNPDAQLFCATVEDELAFGPLQLGLSQNDMRSRIDDCARMCNLGHLLNRPPHRLSGGEKKRVAIASILTVNPSVLLLDEPTAGLDPRTERWLVEFLSELHSMGKTLVMATHDLHLLPELADRAVVLSEDHQVVKTGTPEEVLSDLDLLLEVNLIHSHTHRHGIVTHTHPHVHGLSHERAN